MSDPILFQCLCLNNSLTGTHASQLDSNSLTCSFCWRPDPQQLHVAQPLSAQPNRQLLKASITMYGMDDQTYEFTSRIEIRSLARLPPERDFR